MGLTPQANLRVRYLAGSQARVELDQTDLPEEGDEGPRRALRESLLELGFAGVSLKAFRSGSVSGYIKGGQTQRGSGSVGACRVD